MVWFVLAGMAACVVVAAVWPLFRASAAANADPAANETAFYKAQLEEIRRLAEETVEGKMGKFRQGKDQEKILAFTNR
jgi:cytochrome c-type biogenesis protein CcmI